MSLVETMVALLILAVAGAAVIALTLQILAVGNTAKLRGQGVAYAEEALEQARSFYQVNKWARLSEKRSYSYADGSFSALSTGCPAPCPSYCAAPCPSGAVTGDQIAATTLYRCVQVSGAGSQVQVRAVVNWLDRGVCRGTEANTYFYNY